MNDFKSNFEVSQAVTSHESVETKHPITGEDIYLVTLKDENEEVVEVTELIDLKDFQSLHVVGNMKTAISSTGKVDVS